MAGKTAPLRCEVERANAESDECRLAGTTSGARRQFTPTALAQLITDLSLRRRACRHADLAYSHHAFGIVFLWRRDCQIFGPTRHLAKLADGLCPYFDAGLHFDTHLSGQATESYVERGNAFGLVSHEGSLKITGPDQPRRQVPRIQERADVSAGAMSRCGKGRWRRPRFWTRRRS